LGDLYLIKMEEKEGGREERDKGEET